MKIFVSCAAYREPELELTIASLIENADAPQNLHIGVVQQSTRGERVDFSQNSHVSDIWMRAQEAKGAGYARATAQALWNNEDFFMQIDSHTRMEPYWDTTLIDVYNSVSSATGNERIILSQFPRSYVHENGKDLDIVTFKYPAEPMKQVVYWAQRSLWSALRLPFADPRMALPEESETVLAGFIFAPGMVVTEVPYDPHISFFGEELCFAIRAWTRGWRIYSPNHMVIKHFYQRKGHHKVWNRANNAANKWGGLEKISMDRQADVYNGVITGMWGAPNRNVLQSYYDFIGQDVPGIYNDYLGIRELEARTVTEQDMFMDGFTKAMSIPCKDEEHDKCVVNGCECECHTSPGSQNESSVSID